MGEAKEHLITFLCQLSCLFSLKKEYPKEYFFPIENNHELELSVVIGRDFVNSSFWVESMLLIKGSRKIFRIIGKKYDLSDEDFALSEGMRMYRSFIISI